MSFKRSFQDKAQEKSSYYKERYSGKNKAGKRSHGNFQINPNHLVGKAQSECNTATSSPQDKLEDLLNTFNGKQYGFYKQLCGQRFVFDSFTLVFDRIQTDAYAPPSLIRLVVSQKIAQFPVDLFSVKVRNVASAHYISTLVHKRLGLIQSTHVTRNKGQWSSIKGGTVSIDRPGQEVIERTSVVIDKYNIEVRLTAALPAAGRRIVASVAKRMFLETIPQLVSQALLYTSVDSLAMTKLAECTEDQEFLRSHLLGKKLVCFIGEGSILPRKNGISNLPLVSDNTVPFTSPDSMRVSFVLPNRGRVIGMGIPQGVTLISGGGFNGKSTLLQAMEHGVYNHVPDDGRELVVTVPSAAKIKAEEGRYICNVDIRPFINNLPFGKDTRQFSTEDASGSTSMAASIQEALEAGADALFYDEDTCATNFLVRDRRMQQLVSQKHEPITPLISRIREMWDLHRVSSVLVVGGCGDYLDVADAVIDMYQYKPSDATARAKEIAEQMPVSLETPSTQYGSVIDRAIDIPIDLICYKPPQAKTRCSIALFPSESLFKQNNTAEQNIGCADEEPNITTGWKDDSVDTEMQYTALDVSALDQLVSISQTRAIALIIKHIAQSTDHMRLSEWLSLIDIMDLDSICAGRNKSGNLARPRRIEVAMAINRLRYARIWQSTQE